MYMFVHIHTVSREEINCPVEFFIVAIINCVIVHYSDVALAIVQSDQWEDAMRLCTPWESYTPMKLLIQNMPGIL